MHITKLRRILRRGSAKILSYIPRTNFIEGTPDGLGSDELDELCQSQIGYPLESVSHYPLSGWKRSCTYRLLLQAVTGDKWSVIYKNALYRKDIIPALDSFPINPGPPEYTIYSSAEASIAKYLPAIYMCREVIPGSHYVYLMEDLGRDYRPARDKRDILSITYDLAELYYKAGERNADLNGNSLIIYDGDLSSRLIPYIIESLEGYSVSTNSRGVSAVCYNWDKISALYDTKRDYSGLSTVIHGDANLANILVHKKNRDRVKLIDWEWAGIGLPHQDLASLLKRSKPGVEEDALEIFSNINRDLSKEEHKRLYETCQMERGLIDCAFLANQASGSVDKTKIDIAGYIEDSASRVMEAFYKLNSET